MTIHNLLPELLTEAELFGRFLNRRIVHSTNWGADLEDYTPLDHLDDPGIHGTMQECVPLLLEGIEYSEEPEAQLTHMTEDFECYLAGLKKVSRDFGELKEHCAVLTLAEPPADASEEDWEEYAASVLYLDIGT